MKLQRVKNTINGSFWGIIEKIFNMLLPFIVRTVLIKKIGVDYLGLSSLFTSILQVLSLTELGFGSAVVYSMYKPVADNDERKMSAIVLYLKKVYKIIGISILFIGLCLTPFVPKMINGTIPSDINIYVLFIIYLLNTSVSYFMFSYKSAILSALQLNNIISKVSLITNTLLRILQVIIILITENFYAYVVLIPLLTIINNIIISCIVSKKFPKYLQKCEIDTETKENIKKNIFPLMSTKIASILVNSADTLVISMCLGLSEVAIYNNYYYILNSLMGLLLVIYSAMQAGIGNALMVDSKDKILADFKKFCFINSWLITVCTACLLCLYQTFMELWLGKDMLLSMGMVCLFSLYFYANSIQRIVVIYKDAAGLWKEDMLRCYLSCILNFVVNIATVNYIGLYGVIGSSVVANLIGLPIMGYILYKHVFKISSKSFYFDELKFFVLSLFICLVCFSACFYVPGGIIGLILKGIISFGISNVLLLLFLKKNEQFIISKNWFISKILKKKVS